MGSEHAQGPSQGLAQHGIVVGVDGSDQSTCALLWAAQEAERRKAPLYVVTAYTIPVFAASSMDAGYATVDDDVIRDSAQSVLQEALTHIEGISVEVHARIETGDAAGVLLDLSEEAELMVVGSRGRGGFVGRLLGSVSSALPAHAKCPTAVIPVCTGARLGRPDLGKKQGRDRDGGSSEAVVEPVVVVGVDGSEQARMASLAAAEEARSRGLALRVICSVAPFNGSLAWVPAPVDREALHADLAVQLAAGRDWLQSHYPDVDIRVELVDGSPAEVLISASATSELLVVGTRGRGGFTGMLLGSTSQGVLHHARGPVLVVPDRADPRLEDRSAFGPMIAPAR
ncbi:universal stress protein [Arthrobacter agilis]|uniref:universal stress protein n=1 Tax=Arthrobacter agilis TaxID=37921 RepID=UPI000F70FBC7|nr:universal stress protein [Arthrobacter agilis]WDF33603.1 universal stress protein [Arthrobacter agilis]VDR30999.1 Universal stress protein Rv2623/MT2698 [Arthrobacter agilis]